VGPARQDEEPVAEAAPDRVGPLVAGGKGEAAEEGRRRPPNPGVDRRRGAGVGPADGGGGAEADEELAVAALPDDQRRDRQREERLERRARGRQRDGLEVVRPLGDDAHHHALLAEKSVATPKVSGRAVTSARPAAPIISTNSSAGGKAAI